MLDTHTVLPYAVRFCYKYDFIQGDGKVYAMGLNVKYQLGLGDNKSRYTPTLVGQDSDGNELPFMQKVACTYFGSFTISNEDKIFSWGSGNLGHGNDNQLQKAPKKVTHNV